jgi:hypothetical protein
MLHRPFVPDRKCIFNLLENPFFKFVVRTDAVAWIFTVRIDCVPMRANPPVYVAAAKAAMFLSLAF